MPVATSYAIVGRLVKLAEVRGGLDKAPIEESHRFLMHLSRAGFFCMRPADTNGALEYLRHSPIQAWRKVSPWAFVVLNGILACGCQYAGRKKAAVERTSLSSFT
jgi:hypothetical protein